MSRAEQLLAAMLAHIRAETDAYMTDWWRAKTDALLYGVGTMQNGRVITFEEVYGPTIDLGQLTYKSTTQLRWPLDMPADGSLPVPARWISRSDAARLYPVPAKDLRHDHPPAAAVPEAHRDALRLDLDGTAIGRIHALEHGRDCRKTGLDRSR